MLDDGRGDSPRFLTAYSPPHPSHMTLEILKSLFYICGIIQKSLIKVHKVEVSINILGAGDSVTNVFNYNGDVAIAVKRKTGGTDIVLITKNNENIPFIKDTWKIRKGDNEIQIIDKKSSTKISTF